MANGRGSFDIIEGASPEMQKQIRCDLMRELTRIVGELIDDRSVGADNLGDDDDEN